MMWIETQGFGPTGRIFEDGEEEAELLGGEE